MSEAKVVENEGIFVGRVNFRPETQYTPSGHAKSELQVVRTESWVNQGVDHSREVVVNFSFFGKPAEWLEKHSLKTGERVRVVYNLGSWEGKDRNTKEPTGKHYANLKGFTATPMDRVSTEDATGAQVSGSLGPNVASEEDIPF